MQSPHTMAYWESQQNAGFKNYPERTTHRPFVPEESETVTVAAGQVLKARSFVRRNASGKMVAGDNIAEFAKVAFSGSVASGNTIIIGGLTLTASATMTPAEVVTAFVTKATSKGTFSGTLVDWSLAIDSSNASNLMAYSTTGLTNVADLTITGTHGSLTHTITTVGGISNFQKPAGILAMDVDASLGDVITTMYEEVYAYESEILWGVDTSVDVVMKADGTSVPCTSYNTGAITPLLRQMYVEHTEIEIVTPTAGENLQHG